MYQQFFDMTVPPFAPSPEFYFYADSSNEKTFGNLAVGMARGEGFIIVTGSAGTGKSSLAAMLAKQYRGELFHVAHVVATKSGTDELLRQLSMQLGISLENDNNADLFRGIGIYLAKICAHGGRGIFIVDDAQNLSPKSLNTLRILAGHKVGNKPLLQILLFGRKELLQTLNREEFSSLRKQIVARIYLHPFSAEETQAYILHRLHHADWKDDPHLTLEALRQVYNYTGGIPGKINMVCDHLLRAAYRDNNHLIDGNYTDNVVGALMRRNSIMESAVRQLPRLPANAEQGDVNADVDTIIDKIKDDNPKPYEQLMHAAINRLRPDDAPPILTPVTDDPQLAALNGDNAVEAVRVRPAAAAAARAFGKTLRNHLHMPAAIEPERLIDRIRQGASQFSQKIVSGRQRGHLPGYVSVVLAAVAALGALSYLIGNLVSDDELLPEVTQARNGNTVSDAEIDVMTARIYQELNTGSSPAVAVAADEDSRPVPSRSADTASRNSPLSNQPLAMAASGRDAVNDRGSKPATEKSPLTAPAARSDADKNDSGNAANRSSSDTSVSAAPVGASAAPAATSSMASLDTTAPRTTSATPAAPATARTSATTPGTGTTGTGTAGTGTASTGTASTGTASTGTTSTGTTGAGTTGTNPSSSSDTEAASKSGESLAAAGAVTTGTTEKIADGAVVANASAESDIPVDKRELDILVSKFLRYYETGNLEQYVRLFGENVRTETYRGINSLRSDYEAVFASTVLRQLDFKSVGWSWQGAKAIGTGPITLTTQKTSAENPVTINGRIRLVISRGHDGIFIEEMIQDFNL